MTREKATKVLRQIKTTAAESSLTGSLRDGHAVLVKAYNAIYKYAIDKQWIENTGIVSEINLDDVGHDVCWMDYIGCSAALFASLLDTDSDADIMDLLNNISR